MESRVSLAAKTGTANDGPPSEVPGTMRSHLSGPSSSGRPGRSPRRRLLLSPWGVVRLGPCIGTTLCAVMHGCNHCSGDAGLLVMPPRVNPQLSPPSSGSRVAISHGRLLVSSSHPPEGTSNPVSTKDEVVVVVVWEVREGRGREKKGGRVCAGREGKLVGVCMYVRMYVCVYACVYVCVYVCGRRRAGKGGVW